MKCRICLEECPWLESRMCQLHNDLMDRACAGDVPPDPYMKRKFGKVRLCKTGCGRPVGYSMTGHPIYCPECAFMAMDESNRSAKRRSKQKARNAKALGRLAGPVSNSTTR